MRAHAPRRGSAVTRLAAPTYRQAESEQTNSALALGVAINRDLQVVAAGGYLVQVRPGRASTAWKAVRRRLGRHGAGGRVPWQGAA